MDCDLSAAAHRENPLCFTRTENPQSGLPGQVGLFIPYLSHAVTEPFHHCVCDQSGRARRPAAALMCIRPPGCLGATWALREGGIRWVNSCNTRVSCGLSSAEKVVKVAPADIFHTPVPNPFLTPPPQILGKENTIFAVITLAASPSLGSCGGAY